MSAYDPRLVSELDHWLRERNKAEQQLRRVVTLLRTPETPGAKPCPWSVIGVALGVSKQAAQQRFGSP